MPINKDLVSKELENLRRVSPAGYFIGLHMSLSSACFTYSTYPEAWQRRYQAQGYMLQDPVIAWTFQSIGATRWSDIRLEDTAGVMEAGRQYGLEFGVVVSFEQDGSKSFGSFGRSDREFSDTEILFLSSAIEKLHMLTDLAKLLSKTDLETIRAVATLPYSEAAKKLGVAEVTVKHRMSVIKQRLHAADGKDVVFLAREAQLI